MGTENAGQGGAGAGWGSNLDSGLIRQAMDQYREDYNMRVLEADRQQAGRKAQNIGIAERNRAQRAARQAPGSAAPQQPQLAQSAPVKARRPAGPAKSPWG